MEQPYSNDSLEGFINKIKTIKRVAYGYRNFVNFKQRILVIQQDVQKKCLQKHKFLETLQVSI